MTHETDKAWMEQAIKLAMSKGKSPQDTPIAAIIVLDGKILARAINQTEELCDATAHAEMMAFRKASKVHGDMDLRGCVGTLTQRWTAEFRYDSEGLRHQPWKPSCGTRPPARIIVARSFVMEAILQTRNGI